MRFNLIIASKKHKMYMTENEDPKNPGQEPGGTTALEPNTEKEEGLRSSSFPVNDRTSRFQRLRASFHHPRFKLTIIAYFFAVGVLHLVLFGVLRVPAFFGLVVFQLYFAEAITLFPFRAVGLPVFPREWGILPTPLGWAIILLFHLIFGTLIGRLTIGRGWKGSVALSESKSIRWGKVVLVYFLITCAVFALDRVERSRSEKQESAVAVEQSDVETEGKRLWETTERIRSEDRKSVV